MDEGKGRNALLEMSPGTQAVVCSCLLFCQQKFYPEAPAFLPPALGSAAGVEPGAVLGTFMQRPVGGAQKWGQAQVGAPAERCQDHSPAGNTEPPTFLFEKLQIFRK